MTPEHWQRIETLFQSALEHLPRDRGAYLDSACGNNKGLRQEVLALLVAHEKAGNFIENPAFKAAAFTLAAETPSPADQQADDLTGKRLGAYRILREIGRGGMGTVFLATRDDREYHKQVAIKLIKRGMDTDQILRRFKNERQILANFDHPNIARLLDGGSSAEGLPYLVMEYIEGTPIDRYCDNGRLSTRARLMLFQRVCDAVQYAHQHLVIHRDLKPSNILVTRDGTPKLLDFGIAKLLDPLASSASFEETETALRLITPHYASPEQVRGERVTTASDVYSLGVLLYELLTGQRPYRAKTYSGEELLRAVIQQQPEKPSSAVCRGKKSNAGAAPQLSGAREEGEAERVRRKLAGDLDKIVLMCLRKEAARRYQSVKELSEEISRHLTGLPVLAHKDSLAYRASKFISRNRVAIVSSLTVTLAAVMIAALAYWFATRPRATGAIGSVAVLPFFNAGEDAGIEYLADGVTDNLIDSLAQVGELAVRPRSAIWRYKLPAEAARQYDAKAIGRQLNVEAIVFGSIAQRGDDLRIEVELIDARDNHRLWRKTYYRKAAEILFTEQEMARQVADKLRLKPYGRDDQLPGKSYTENSAAYYLYLKGRFLWNKRTEESLHRSIDYYRQAIAQDPNYAMAYAGIADSNVILGYIRQPKGCFEEAEVKASRALELDDTLAEAHTSLARVNAAYRWNWPAAEAEYTRAIELKPDYAIAHIWYADYLAVNGRVKESVEEARLALRLDPLSALVNSQLIWYLYLNHQYAEAIEQGQKSLEIDASLPAPYYYMALAYLEQNRYDEAIVLLRQRLAIAESAATLQMLGYAYARVGKEQEAQKVLKRLLELRKKAYLSPYFIGVVYAGLGKKDEAFEWFEKGCEDRSPWMLNLKLLPLFDSLRVDARYKALLLRMKLEP